MENSKVHLSPNSFLLLEVLADAHSLPTGRHFGYLKTINRVSSSFIWPGLRIAVKEFIRNCIVCQLCKYDTFRPAGLLYPLAIPDRIWIDISMDFIDGLSSSQSHDTIMVVVDRLSKFAHFVPLKHPYTALSVAKAFISNIIRLHGMPLSIVSDRDRIFLSNFWRSLFQLHSTAFCYSSNYHPQLDGQTEVINHILEQYLRCYTYDNPKKWLEWLSWDEFGYNTSVHSSTKITPFEAVYGVPPPSMISYIPGTPKSMSLTICCAQGMKFFVIFEKIWLLPRFG